jgi:hypothetical protein
MTQKKKTPLQQLHRLFLAKKMTYCGHIMSGKNKSPYLDNFSTNPRENLYEPFSS